jgi:hypothetical protein
VTICSIWWMSWMISFWITSDLAYHWRSGMEKDDQRYTVDGRWGRKQKGIQQKWRNSTGVENQVTNLMSWISVADIKEVCRACIIKFRGYNGELHPIRRINHRNVHTIWTSVTNMDDFRLLWCFRAGEGQRNVGRLWIDSKSKVKRSCLFRAVQISAAANILRIPKEFSGPESLINSASSWENNTDCDTHDEICERFRLWFESVHFSWALRFGARDYSTSFSSGSQADRPNSLLKIVWKMETYGSRDSSPGASELR